MDGKGEKAGRNMEKVEDGRGEKTDERMERVEDRKGRRAEEWKGWESGQKDGNGGKAGGRMEMMGR